MQFEISILTNFGIKHDLYQLNSKKLVKNNMLHLFREIYYHTHLMGSTTDYNLRDITSLTGMH